MYDQSYATNFSLDGSGPCPMIFSHTLQIHIHTLTHKKLGIYCMYCSPYHRAHCPILPSLHQVTFNLLYPFSFTIQPCSYSFSVCFTFRSQTLALILFLYTGCRSWLSARCRLHTHKWMLSNTTLSTWMKTHCTHTGKHLAEWMINNARKCMCTCKLSFISWTHCYGILSALRCVYISVNAHVRMVTLERRHCPQGV